MEQVKNLSGIRLHLNTSPKQMGDILKSLIARDSSELMLFPNPDNCEEFVGFMLQKHYDPLLEKWFSVLKSEVNGTFHILHIARSSMRSYLTFLARRVFPPQPRTDKADSSGPIPIVTDIPILQPADCLSDEFTHEWDHTPAEDDPVTKFLKSTSPVQIERLLNEKVIGQPALTKAVADFLYYHALRQLHPELPQRPLLIAGPSGSGKTEVWRAASKLYGHLFPIKIVDGSSISCEGWAGNYKIDTYMNPAFADGGILVVDEFDKLTKPRHSGAGDNVSQEIQAEFLKLVEGEYHITDKKKQTNQTTKRMGFVMVGAFESLWISKEQPAPAPHIGFCTDGPAVVQKPNTPEMLTDEDFIAYGILPELIGRIAVKCATKSLSDEAYLDIIRGPHSRVTAIEQILKQYGTEVTDVISNEELRQMVATSKSNRTGVRWVSAQVENRLLDAIREHGLFPDRAA